MFLLSAATLLFIGWRVARKVWLDPWAGRADPWNKP